MYRYFLVGGCLFIISCGQKSVTKNVSQQGTKVENVVSVPEATVDVKKRAAVNAELLGYLRQFERPVQRFVVEANSNKEVVGAKGTKIYIVPGDLEGTDGTSVSGPVTVSLIELQDQHDFIRNRMATTSNGKLLESDGSYYINCSAGGKQLRLKQGKRLAVQFPRRSSKSMQLFYGVKTKEGGVNWEPDREILKPKTTPDSIIVDVPVAKYKDTILAEMEVRPDHKPVNVDASRFRQYGKTGVKLIDGRFCYVARVPDLSNPVYVKKKIAAGSNNIGDVYEVAQLLRMGWINCDRFYNAEMIPLAVEIGGTDLHQDIETYVLFKGINGIVSEHMYYKPEGHYTISRLPKNSQATVVSFSWKDGTPYGAATSVTIQDNSRVALDLKPVSKAEIVKLMSM